MTYNYFIPVIHLGPVSGYIFTQELPLHGITDLIIGNNAKFEVIRKVLLNKIILYEKRETIEFKQKKWLNKNSAYFQWESPKKISDLCYIETQVNLIHGTGLKASSLPSFYVNYISANKKNFMSCGNEKYGNPRVIMQMKEFGMWVDGYPAVNISLKNKTTYSMIIINPYKVANSFTIEINSLGLKKSIKIAALSVKKVNFYDIVKKNTWTGQFYIYGKRRAIIYLINHAFNDINNVSTLEHSDPFRAELTHQPRMQYLRNKIHKKIKEIFH